MVEKAIVALETVVRNMVRVGQVSSLDEPNRTAKVAFYDRGTTIVSGDLKILKNSSFIPAKGVPQRTENEAGGGGYAEYESHSHEVIISPWLPYVGDYVLCIYFGRSGGDGFVIGGL
ncbi:MAG: hypothetical protein R3Y63_09380 [Eubacteriales bacterium]